MLSEGTRKIDLYDLISIVLPGACLTLGLIPFLPHTFDILDVGALVPFIILSFVFGRLVHIIAVESEDVIFQATPTHRERLQQQLSNPTDFSEDTAKQFIQECSTVFDVTPKEANLDEDEMPDPDKVQFDDLYNLVRSYIHMDSRGRSRVFQAIYSFYRSMWIVMYIIGVAFLYYYIVTSFPATTPSLEYTSFLEDFPGDANILSLLIAGSSLLSMRLFDIGRKQFQGHYIRYIVADFLVLQNVDYPEAVVMAEKLPNDTDDD